MAALLFEVRQKTRIPYALLKTHKKAKAPYILEKNVLTPGENRQRKRVFKKRVHLMLRAAITDTK